MTDKFKFQVRKYYNLIVVITNSAGPSDLMSKNLANPVNASI